MERAEKTVIHINTRSHFFLSTSNLTFLRWNINSCNDRGEWRRKKELFSVASAPLPEKEAAPTNWFPEE